MLSTMEGALSPSCPCTLTPLCHALMPFHHLPWSLSHLHHCPDFAQHLHPAILPFAPSICVLYTQPLCPVLACSFIKPSLHPAFECCLYCQPLCPAFSPSLCTKPPHLVFVPKLGSYIPIINAIKPCRTKVSPHI